MTQNMGSALFSFCIKEIFRGNPILDIAKRRKIGLFIYGKEIPLENAVFEASLPQPTTSKETIEFMFTYGKEIFSDEQVN